MVNKMEDKKRPFKKKEKVKYQKKKKENVHDGSEKRYYWKNDKDYITPDTFKNKFFPLHYTTRLHELEKLTNTKRRKIILEILQIDKLENKFFLTDIKQGEQTTIIIDGEKEIVNQNPTTSVDEFRAVVQTQGVNHTFVERDAFELWLMRRYQTTTFQDKQRRYSKQRGELANVLKVFYKYIRPDVLDWMKECETTANIKKNKRRTGFKEKQKNI